MVERWENRATGTLASSISAGATSLTLSSGQGALFPALTSPDHFWAVLETGSLFAPSAREIVRVTARSGDVLTITRAQQGTSALAFNAGDRVVNRITQTTLETLRDSIIQPTRLARRVPPTAFFGARASAQDPWGSWGNTIATVSTLANTSQLAGQYRAHHSSTSTANGNRGVATESVARGNAANIGGFRYEGKLGINANNNNTRMFVGLVDSPSAFLLASADPSAAVSNSLFGFGWDNASVAATDHLRFYHHDGGGGAVTDTDTGIVRTDMLIHIVYFLIQAEPNASSIRIVLRDLVNGNGIDQQVSSNLPAATTLLVFQWSCRGNGSSNTAQLASVGSIARPHPT